MAPKALLELATELIHRVLRFDRPADAIVSAFFREHRSLGGRERATLAETAYAVLRRKPFFQHVAQSGRGELERRLAILAWSGNEGVLRGALTEAERDWATRAAAIDLGGLPSALRHNLPAWIAEPLQAALGHEFWPMADALGRPAGLDLRVNRLKADRDAVRAELAAAGHAAEPTPYSPIGLRLETKPALTKLEVFARGDIEVQDEGSQLLALLVGARRGEMVADFCAGAGGKTLALGAEMRNTGRLYAFDTSGHRLAALRPRLARSGLSNVYPIQIAHERDERLRRLAGKLDRVLVDAPCSGLGTLRRNPDLKWRQSPAAVDELRVKQAAILGGAARLVKPGGRLVFATCSLLEAENEAIAAEFGQAHADAFEPLPIADALARAQAGAPEQLVQGDFLRLWPHRHRTDGFFAAAWVRRAD